VKLEDGGFAIAALSFRKPPAMDWPGFLYPLPLRPFPSPPTDHTPISSFETFDINWPVSIFHPAIPRRICSSAHSALSRTFPLFLLDLFNIRHFIK
jgi:hypothetical protein